MTLTSCGLSLYAGSSEVSNSSISVSGYMLMKLSDTVDSQISIESVRDFCSNLNRASLSLDMVQSLLNTTISAS